MKHNNYCGLCRNENLVLVLDLGSMPLANAFHENRNENLVEYPLKVYFCRSCSSVQLLDIVDPELVFRKYEYLTSASKPLSNHFVEMGKSLADKFITSKKDLVVEIGGNDGVLLDAIKDRCRVLNVDPAWNASWLAMGGNVATMGTFFNSDIASVIEKHYGKAKVIVANNVMAHIENIYDVAKGVGNLLTEDGVFVFEVHWIGNLIGDGGFDQIYHEHLYYHSLTALRNYFGESLFDVELVPIHGQSMRVYTGNRQVCPSVEEFVNKEKELGLDSEHTYTGFYDKIHANKMMLKDILGKFNKVVGYGAPAKGNTLINYYDLQLDYIVDTTPGKQGLFTPGKNIPVHHPEMLLKEPPDAVLVLAWNYADTILKKEQALRDKGVKFIIPVPEVKVL